MKRLFSIFACFALAVSLLVPQVAFADDADASGYTTDGETAITKDGTAFGLQQFERAQTGMNKTYSQKYCGYVFPLGEGAQDDICFVVTDENVIVYISDEVAAAAGFTGSDADKATLEDMLYTLDETLSNGGTKLSTMGLPFVYTNETTVKQGGYTYTFAQEIEEGRYYVTCMAKGGDKEQSRSAAQFCLHGKLSPAADVVIEGAGTWLDELASFLDPANLDYRPLWVSLKTAAVAMIFISILGTLAAWRAMHVKSRWKGVFDSIFTIPMVLPPTVCGFILLVIFGNSTAFGRWLMDHGIELVFSWPAAVLAAVVVGFPLMYRTVLGAFETLDVNMLDAARTLGWKEGRIFTRLMLPLSWPSIASGLVLAFARAMGEFGATLFVAGNYAGVTQTMPIAIYFSWMGGNTPVAVFWVVVVIVISFIIILIINLYSAHVQRYRRAGGKAAKDEPVLEEGEVSFAIDEAMAAELGFTQQRVGARGGEV